MLLKVVVEFPERLWHLFRFYVIIAVVLLVSVVVSEIAKVVLRYVFVVGAVAVVV